MAVSEASPMEALIGFYVEASRIAPLIVVQLVEWLCPTPEVYGSIQSLENIYVKHLYNVIEKTKKKKRPRSAHFQKE